jgi:2-aminoadipate transaminase
VKNDESLERVRRALLETALRAYEDAGVRGLCEEGRFEAAIDAIRSADLSRLAVEDDDQEIPK